MLFRGKRGAVCGKRLTFQYTILINICNITFEVPRLSTFVFIVFIKKHIHDYILD